MYEVTNAGEGVGTRPVCIDATHKLIICTGTPPPPTGPICGNSIVESGEQCDDGNTTDGDGCSSTCQNEEANNSHVGYQLQCDSININQICAIEWMNEFGNPTTGIVGNGTPICTDNGGYSVTQGSVSEVGSPYPC